MKRVTRTALTTPRPKLPTLMDRAQDTLAATHLLDAKQKEYLSVMPWQPLARTSGWWVGHVYVMMSGSVVVHHESDGRTTRIPIKF